MKVIKRDDGKVDLIGIQSKTWILNFVAKDENGDLIDITNAQIRGQIRKTWNSPDVIATWQITKTNPTQGEFKATISASTTANIPCGDKVSDPKSQYVYDFEIEFADGTVMEIAKGKLLVEWEVTK